MLPAFETTWKMSYATNILAVAGKRSPYCYLIVCDGIPAEHWGDTHLERASKLGCIRSLDLAKSPRTPAHREKHPGENLPWVLKPRRRSQTSVSLKQHRQGDICGNFQEDKWNGMRCFLSWMGDKS
ncbi:Huntingtin [Manis pentadactyla]|nr:Huntingtin [Manis pentadactyla]